MILRSLQELARSVGFCNSVPDHHSPNCNCLQAAWLLLRGEFAFLLIFPSEKVQKGYDQPSKSIWSRICALDICPQCAARLKDILLLFTSPLSHKQGKV